MKIRVKKTHPNGKVPTRGSKEAAGYDLYAATVEYIQAPYDNLAERSLIKYSTGVSFEIPEGHVGLLFPRSSIYKKPLSLTNCVGVLDSDYRGEVSFVFRRDKKSALMESFEIGDRIGQLVIVKHETLEFEEVENLNSTERGTGGFGSTGR